MIANKALDTGRTKGPRRVDGRAGVVGADDVGDEDGNANADGGEVGSLVLFHGQEVDSQYELGSEEHLQKDALDLGGAIAEGVGHGKGTWEKAVNDSGGSNGSNELSWDDDDASEWLDGADQH